MKCPTCRTTDLRSGKVVSSDVVLDRCLSCKGVWFDGGELARLLNVEVQNLKVPGEARQSPRTCPKCAAHMYTFYYPRTFVAVDMCKKCPGIWLDEGEFSEITKVRSHLERSGVKKEPPEPTGIKGGLLTFVNNAIKSLAPW